MYDVPDTVPHVSLAKSQGSEWKSLGILAAKCAPASDWGHTQHPHVGFSPSAGCYKQSKPIFVPTSRNVGLVDDDHSDTSTHVHTLLIEQLTESAAAIPSLKKVEDDVGLFRNCDHLISPKSSYRPCQQQYPLKQEDVDVIGPVFQSLLETGVIVPCMNYQRIPKNKMSNFETALKQIEWSSLLSCEDIDSSCSTFLTTINKVSSSFTRKVECNPGQKNIFP